MMFYEHALAFQSGQEVEYEIDPPSLELPGVTINEHGHRVYNR